MSGPLDFPGDEPSAPERRAPAPAPAPGGARPPRRPPPSQRPIGASRYGWFLGVVGVLLLAGVTLNTVGTEGVGGGPTAGERLVPFAVPLAGAPAREDEDANVDPERACRVRGPGVLNICALAERGPLVLALFPTDAGECRSVLAQLDRVRARLPGVQLVAVGSEGDRRVLARPPRPYPVGWDRDRAVAALYGLAGCPQLHFARRGGEVLETTRRPLSDADLVALARRLRAGS